MKSLFRRGLLAAVPAALLMSALPAVAQKAPERAPAVSGAWARPTVEGQRAGGGFVTIQGGSSDDRLLAAKADVSATLELHTMSMDGDVMRMRRVEAIDVPAGKTVRLEPGGLHLMFMGLKSPLQAGSSFPLTLQFEKAGTVTTQVTVSARAPQGAAADAHKH